MINAEAIEIVTDTGAIIDPETGEVLGMADAPETVDPEELANYLSERLIRANAELAGLKAAKQQYLDRIAEMFDSEIKQTERTVEWLRTNPSWTHMLREWAEKKLVGAKTKTLKHGLLKLSFRSSRESIEVVNEQAAIDWARANWPKALRVVESIAKSEIPAQMREHLTAESGLVYHPKGETETFEVE